MKPSLLLRASKVQRILFARYGSFEHTYLLKFVLVLCSVWTFVIRCDSWTRKNVRSTGRRIVLLTPDRSEPFGWSSVPVPGGWLQVVRGRVRWLLGTQCVPPGRQLPKTSPGQTKVRPGCTPHCNVPKSMLSRFRACDCPRTAKTAARLEVDGRELAGLKQVLMKARELAQELPIDIQITQCKEFIERSEKRLAKMEAERIAETKLLAHGCFVWIGQIGQSRSSRTTPLVARWGLTNLKPSWHFARPGLANAADQPAVNDRRHFLHLSALLHTLRPLATTPTHCAILHDVELAQAALNTQHKLHLPLTHGLQLAILNQRPDVLALQVACVVETHENCAHFRGVVT